MTVAMPGATMASTGFPENRDGGGAERGSPAVRP